MRESLVASVIFVIALFETRVARASDPRKALDELKQGYSLKQLGNCAQAMPHFMRSFLLDEKPKPLLNLADCEQQIGHLVAAKEHATEGRELAQSEQNTELAGVADEQLASIEKRLPRVVLRLNAGAPANCVVSLDGVTVEATSLGASVAVDPGKHSATVTAPGYAERRFDLTAAEGEGVEMVVAPGSKLGAEVVTTPGHDSTDTSKWLAYSAFGVGAIGLVVGVASGIAGGSTHAALLGECNGYDCPPGAQGDLDTFHSQRTISTIGYVVGLVGVASGAALWFIRSSAKPTAAAAHVWLGPSSAGVGGRF